MFFFFTFCIQSYHITIFNIQFGWLLCIVSTWNSTWNSEEKENKTTGKIEFIENYSGKRKISDVSEVKYLGNKLSCDGSNSKDIAMKCYRGIGTTNKIQNILDTMYFGQYYFEVGIKLIESMI